MLAEPSDTLALLAALEEQEAALYARRAELLVTYRDEQAAKGSLQRDLVPMDLAVTCGIAQSTASHRLSVAAHLVEALPLTHRFLAEGALHLGQALALLDETKGLDPAVCGQVEDRVLPEIIGMSTGDTRRWVKKALLALDVANAEERRQARRAERRAFLSPQPDGQAFVGVFGSAEDGSRYWHELTLLAKLTFGDADPRTLDQQRSDLALGLAGFALTARHGHGPSLRSHLGLVEERAVAPCSLARSNALTPDQRSRVQGVVLVPVQTALGLSDEPGELVGYGPVSGPHARDLLAAAELRKACTDLATGRLVALSDERVRPPSWAGVRWPTASPPTAPVTIELDDGRQPSRPSRSSRRRAARARQALQGSPLTLYDVLQEFVSGPLPEETRSEDRHDPSRGLADLVRLRDTRCIGPGCSQPSRSCDLEHWQAHPDGPTAAWNVGPASRRCHNAKTHGGWSYTPHPDGSVTWTTPWGATHVRPSRAQPARLTHLAPRTVVPPHQRHPA